MTKSYIVLILCSLVSLGLMSFGPILFISYSDLGLASIPIVLFTFASWIPGTLISVLLYLIIQRKTGLQKISLKNIFLIALLINLPGMFAINISEYILEFLRGVDLLTNLTLQLSQNFDSDCYRALPNPRG